MAQILAVDFGTRRLGIAVSDAEAKFALPLLVLELPPRARPAAVAELATERDINTVVVGRPRRSQGEDSALWPEIEKFGVALQRRGLTVVYEDEGFSTVGAEAELKARGVTAKQSKKANLDAMAAKLILEQYLRGRRHE